MMILLFCGELTEEQLLP